MTRLLIEALFSEGADKETVVDKVLAMQAAGTLSYVWKTAPPQDRDNATRLLAVTPNEDDSVLKSALWDIAILDGLKEVKVSTIEEVK